MTLSRTVRRRLIAAVGVGATVVSIAAVAQPATAASGRTIVPGTATKWLAHAHDRGAVAKSANVNFGVLLKMRDQSQAVAKLQQLSKPEARATASG